MKTSLCLVAVSVIGLLLPVGCSDGKKPAAPVVAVEVWPELEQLTALTNEAQKIGYSVGLDHGQNLKQQFQGMKDLDLKALAYGFSDEVNGRVRKFPNEVIGKNVEAMRRRINDKIVVPLDAREAGYAIGIDHAYNVLQQMPTAEMDLPALAQGLYDEIHNLPKKLPEAEIQEAITTIRRKMVDQMMAEGLKEKTSKKAPENAKNLEEGRKFLEENARKEGVKSTASGLQYIVLLEGTGHRPAASDRVEVHYKGSLLNGTVFDSSYVRSTPIVFGLGEVIKGWTEGVQLMSVGSKYKFFIPSHLAYGEFGAPPSIPGNSTLIFEVELLKIEK